MIEVGVPFSDPLADGPVIQRASERALASKTTLRGTLQMIEAARSAIAAPIVIFTYANPVLRMGEDAFVAAAADAGVDGVLVLDLPVEEAGPFRDRLVGGRPRPDFPAEPDDDRRADPGVGGHGQRIPVRDLAAWRDRRARPGRDGRRTAGRIGFGRSRICRWRWGSGSRARSTSREVGRWADAAVVGSALVNVIAEHGASPDVADRAGAYVRWLKGQA